MAPAPLDVYRAFVFPGSFFLVFYCHLIEDFFIDRFIFIHLSIKSYEKMNYLFITMFFGWYCDIMVYEVYVKLKGFDCFIIKIQ